MRISEGTKAFWMLAFPLCLENWWKWSNKGNSLRCSICFQRDSLQVQWRMMVNPKENLLLRFWIGCNVSAIFVAIVSRKQPERVPDLIGYQWLIIDAHHEYQGVYWTGYDRHFWQRAAATHSVWWACIDTTLWSLAFAGWSNMSSCKFCFSITSEMTNCSQPNCVYEYIGYLCFQGHPVHNKFHKSMYCSTGRPGLSHRPDQ